MKNVLLVTACLSLAFACHQVGTESGTSAGEGAASFSITHDCFKELRLGEVKAGKAVDVTLAYGACGTDGVNTYRNLYMVKTAPAVKAALAAGESPEKGPDFAVVVRGKDVGIQDASHGFVKIGSVDEAKEGALVSLGEGVSVDFAVPGDAGEREVYHYSASQRRFFDKEDAVQVWVNAAG